MLSVRSLLAVVMLAAALPAVAADCEAGLQKYMNGDAVSAKKIFESLAKKGDSCAQFNLGLMHFYGHGTDKDEKQARTLIQQSAKAGYKKAREAIDNWEVMKRRPDLTSGAGKV